MKTKLNSLPHFLPVTLTLVLAGSSALAHSWHHHFYCDVPMKDSRLVSQTTTVTGACQQIEKLQLGRASHTYPLLNDATLEVDFWQGAFGLSEQVRSVYQIDIYSCDGILQNSYQATDEQDVMNTFSVDNPNLHDDVSASFEANAPMTDQEAAQALEVARQKCEAAQASR